MEQSLLLDVTVSETASYSRALGRAIGRPPVRHNSTIVLILFALGVGLGLVLPSARCVTGVGASLVLASLILAAPFAYRLRLGIRSIWALALGAGFIVTGLHGEIWGDRQLQPACYREAVTVMLEVTGFPLVYQLPDGSERQRFEARGEIVAPERCNSPRRFSVTADRTLYLPLGSRVSVSGILRPMEVRLVPGVPPVQARHTAAGLDARLNISTLNFYERRAEEPISRFRDSVAARIKALAIPKNLRAYALALVVGDQAAIGDDDWQIFKSLGIAHTLVISGLHISLLSFVVWHLLGLPRRVGNVPHDEGGVLWQVFGTLFAAWMYAGLAGWSLPTVRAAIMVSCLLVPKALCWQVQPRHGLLLAIAIILVLNPFDFLTSSFWMSCGAVACLIFINARLPDRSMWLRAAALQGLLLVLMAPLSVFWFGAIAPVGLIGNLLLVPVFTFWIVPLLLLGTLMLSVFDIEWVIHWALAPLDWLAGSAVMSLIDDYPLMLTTSHLSLAVALVALCFSLMPSMGAGARKLAVTCLAMMMLIWVRGLIVDRTPRLMVIDVGQGTAIVFSDGMRSLLYDTGGGIPGVFSEASRGLIPWMHDRRISSLSEMVVSHSDFDHRGGVRDVADNFSVEHIYGYGGEPCRTGLAWRWPSGVAFQFLSGDGTEEEGSNASSCVLLIDAGGFRIMLTGDVPKSVELDLVSYWREALNADVLLAAHHGSKTSSAPGFLKWVTPERVVLNYGIANSFNHPHSTVSETLGEFTSEIDHISLKGSTEYRMSPSGVAAIPGRSIWSPFWLKLPQ